MRKNSLLLIIMAILLSGIFLTDALAKEQVAPTPMPSALRKLGRGSINIVSGWLELFLQPTKETKPYEMFLAVFRGFGYGVGRTFSGVYEVLTFPIPIPSDYESVIEPESVFAN